MIIVILDDPRVTEDTVGLAVEEAGRAIATPGFTMGDSGSISLSDGSQVRFSCTTLEAMLGTMFAIKRSLLDGKAQ